MAPEQPIAARRSSRWARRRRAQAEFSRAAGVPKRRAKTRWRMAPAPAMSDLFSSHRERLKIAVTPCSWS